jgi:hypothetical protein
MPPDQGLLWVGPRSVEPMPGYRKTKSPGVFVRHQNACPAAGGPGERCRCQPSWRGRRWNASVGRPAWSPTFRERAEVQTWLAANDKGSAAVEEVAAQGPSFSELANEWLERVRSGAVGRRRGKRSTGYSATTLAGYVRSLRYVLGPEFGARPAAGIEPREWQMWVDRVSREGLSRSRIATISRLHERSTDGQRPPPAASSKSTPWWASSFLPAMRSHARESPTQRRPPRYWAR